MFMGKLPTKSDLEKGKKKRYTNNCALDAIPFWPSQLSLIKSLISIFQVISGHLAEAGIILKQMMKV